MSRSNRERYTAVRQSFWRKPKTVALSLAGIGLWTLGQSYCSDEMTDGFIPDGVALMLSRGDKKALRHLIESTYWLRVEGGYQVNKYLKHNLSRVELETRSDAKKVAGSLGGQARASAIAAATAAGVASATATATGLLEQSSGESLQDLRPQTSDARKPPLRVGEADEGPPKSLSELVARQLALTPTPGSVGKLLELLSELHSHPSGRPYAEPGMLSANDRKLLAGVIVAAQKLADGGPMDPMRIIASEWVALLALVANGDKPDIRNALAYFAKCFGGLEDARLEASANHVPARILEAAE